MQRELPSGTVTFLFTDVEGSTKLLEEIGDEAYDDALAEHRRVVREACAEHGGVEVDTQGDAFFFAFPTPPGALAAASAMTHALAPGPIEVRIGLHTGEPRVTEEGYVGKEVHFAARVAATGHGGQIVLSKATAELVEADVTALGEHRLKDIPEPVPIYQLGSESFPPLKTISNTNLPRPASSFVGRERELAEVLVRIEQGARLLTLTGPGGSGKTRLALEAAATLIPEHKAGVFWVGLAALRDPALVPEQIAQTLGAKDGLHEHIGERELLLLLDNLEQVIEAAPELASLLEACPNLTLLCTSRELLRVRGEVEYPVPPLASPEAVELFCSRSGLKSSAEIAELCARLDNLPLAVELAAARTKALTVPQILERLSQRLDLLKGGRDADPRQQTLRATIEWSYDLLSAEEQRLFRSLSVFAGGCTLGAAEEVAGADLDTLQSLVEKSLLRFTNGRYWMLETIREYAAERLEASGEAGEMRERHALHYLALAEEADPYLREVALRGGLHQLEWLDRLETEHDNLRAALDQLATAGETQLALRMAGALVEFWFENAHFVELRTRPPAALAADDRPTAARAKVLIGAADTLAVSKDPAGAMRCAEEALAIYRAIRDQSGTADALWRQAAALSQQGDDRAAQPILEEALALFNDVDDRHSAVSVIRSLASGYLNLGDRERATELYRESLSRARAVDNTVIVSASLGALAMIAAEDGRPDEALALAWEHLPLRRDLGRLDHSTSLCRVAWVLAHAGRATAAVSLLAYAEALAHEIGASWGWTEAQNARTRAIAHAALDDDAFAEAWERGLALTEDDAMALARRELAPEG